MKNATGRSQTRNLITMNLVNLQIAPITKHLAKGLCVLLSACSGKHPRDKEDIMQSAMRMEVCYKATTAKAH